MKTCTTTGLILFACFALLAATAGKPAFGKEDKKPEPEAKAIEATASIESNHPAVEEGISCSDCHEITVDANSTATQAWLTGEYLRFKAGEGIMPESMVWKRIIDIFKGKGMKRSMVLATTINNKPLTTTAEYAIDPENGILYGLHEKGTEKLFHIKNNPNVCLNWHREFDDNFMHTLCIQVVGKAEILTGTDKGFEEGLRVYPYQYGAAARKLSVEKWREIIIKEMDMTKIVIDQVTLVDGRLAGTEYRTSQRWERK